MVGDTDAGLLSSVRDQTYRLSGHDTAKRAGELSDAEDADQTK